MKNTRTSVLVFWRSAHGPPLAERKGYELRLSALHMWKLDRRNSRAQFIEWNIMNQAKTDSNLHSFYYFPTPASAISRCGAVKSPLLVFCCFQISTICSPIQWNCALIKCSYRNSQNWLCDMFGECGLPSAKFSVLEKVPCDFLASSVAFHRQG